MIRVFGKRVSLSGTAFVPELRGQDVETRKRFHDGRRVLLEGTVPRGFHGSGR